MYLLEHPNPRGEHFYRQRRGSILAIVVHVTAGIEDLDGHDDQSAEATAAYAASTDRDVSWHSGSDTDSVIELLPAEFTAWHCRGYNSRTYGHEISKRTTDWRTMGDDWINATLGHAASHLGPLAQRLGVPARRASRLELDTAIANGGTPVGFIGHWELDPTRRTDPGKVGLIDTFPWNEFIGRAANPTMPFPSLPARPPAPPAGGARVAITVNVPTLSEGARGEHVKGLQGQLNAKARQGLEEDGVFGPATERAVRNWQAFFQMDVDGVVGPATWKSLIEIPLI